MQTWRNWSRTAACSPTVVRPTCEEDISRIVAQARQRGQQVKAVGSGHSFTDCATTTGVMVRLDNFTSIEWIGPTQDDGSRFVRVGAGIPLSQLSRQLHARGLALENMGDIDKQTIAGAISTGTHGTGRAFTGFSGQVHHVRVVTSTGQVIDASPSENPELFQAARLGLGAIGIITAVTLRVVPAFVLRAHEAPRSLTAVLESILDPQGPVLSADHFEFYWFPHTDIALTKTNTRHPRNDLPLPTWRRMLDDELLSNGVFSLTNNAVKVAPKLTRVVNQIAARALTERTYTAPSHDVFVTPRRVRFREMEYAIALEHFPQAFEDIRRVLSHTNPRVPFPIEVRFAAGDEVWLSTAFQRPSAYIAFHQFIGMDYKQYFQEMATIMAEYGGRPHWGKLHWLGVEELRDLYPRFDDFLTLRDETDPTRVFANRHTMRVLGP